MADGRFDEAREAVGRAAASAVDTRRALQSLALVQMQMGKTTEAVAILTRLTSRQPRDLATRRVCGTRDSGRPLARRLEGAPGVRRVIASARS